MNIDKISSVAQLQSSPVSSGSELEKKQKENLNTPGSNSQNDQVQLQTSVPSQTLDKLQKIGSVTDSQNNMAVSLRATGNGLSEAADIAAKMRSTLEKITKNYPPFPIDSAERRDILMSYRALQKEMEKLMVPQPPTPVYDKVPELWKDLFAQHQAGTISTPNLPEKASDTVVADAVKQLGATGDAISTLHAAIGASI